MGYLIAAVILVGALCTIDLLLTFGVIRRLREHTELLAQGGGPGGPTVLRPGERVTGVVAVDVDGRPVPTDVGLVGFFSPSCVACEQLLPKFADRASGFPGGPDRVLAVIADELPGTGKYEMALHGLARIVLEPDSGPLATAFRVTAYPAWCLLDGTGTVLASGHAADPLPVDPLPAKVAA